MKRNVIITGASSGIGATLAALLAKDGASIILAARRRERLEELAKSLTSVSHGKIVVVRCDVTVKEDAEELIHRSVRELGSLDVLVNNAGRGHLAPVEETTDEVIKSMFAVNVYSLWNTTRPALLVMKQQKSGHIINVASMAGKVGYPLNSAYVAAKHACVGFTKALRLELAETGVTASVVCPAGVLTDWSATTEGAPMLPLFDIAKPIIARIAQERQIERPQVEGAVTPERVADKIIECINHPTAEVYVHDGSKEWAEFASLHPEEAERKQLPAVLGEFEAYETMRRTR